MKIQHFSRKKSAHDKIVMVTCYDYWSAKILNTTDIDCILVGDSSAMIMHGEPTTITATADMIVAHVRAVSKGADKKFIVADMPFLSCRKGITHAMNIVEQLVQAGAHAVKIEGITGNEDLVGHIVESGIPVMGHLGLTAQMLHQLGGYKIQGKTQEAQNILSKDAKKFEESGAFALVIECVPYLLAQAISETLSIPTIGIGAGSFTDGQVLVLHDLLGLLPDFQPKFVKKYLEGATLMQEAISQFIQEVKCHDFPTANHHFE